MKSFIESQILRRRNARREGAAVISHVVSALAFLVLTVTAATATETRFDPATQRMPVGDGAFDVDNVSRGPVTIYTYRPAGVSSDSPIWVIMPGTRRDAARHLAFDYYDTWRPLADRYGAILLVPEFTAEKWPGAAAYNLGNVRSRRLEAKPWQQTSFYVVEEAFRMAAHSLGTHRRKFSMFGHGAGCAVHSALRAALGLPHDRPGGSRKSGLVSRARLRVPVSLRAARLANSGGSATQRVRLQLHPAASAQPM